MQAFFDQIDASFSAIDIKLTDKQKQQFYDYYKLLIDWNNKFNLTAITEKTDVIKKHFLDSCCAVNLLKLN